MQANPPLIQIYNSILFQMWTIVLNWEDFSLCQSYPGAKFFLTSFHLRCYQTYILIKSMKSSQKTAKFLWLFRKKRKDYDLQVFWSVSQSNCWEASDMRNDNYFFAKFVKCLPVYHKLLKGVRYEKWLRCGRVLKNCRL